MSRYVYLVRFRPLLTGTGHLKVGYSEKLKIGQQLSRYRTYYPKFNMLAYSHNNPKQFEHYLKWKLQDYNIGNELFYEDCINTAIELCERECELIANHEVKIPNNEFLL